MQQKYQHFFLFNLSILFAFVLSFSCNKTKQNQTYKPIFVQETIASWYGKKFHGKKTANGERYDMNDFTAAHRYLNFGTIVRVTNLKNNKTVRVRINDRGPFTKNRGIDLSKQAAREIGMIESGTANVKIEIIDYPVCCFQKIFQHLNNIPNLLKIQSKKPGKTGS